MRVSLREVAPGFAGVEGQVLGQQSQRVAPRQDAFEQSARFLLAAYRDASGSLTKAAFLSARNDAIANVAIIAAGAMTLLVWRSPWPDLIVGFGIAWMNLDAAKEVWEAARKEHEAVA